MSILIDGTNGITLPSGAVSNTTGTVVGTTDTQTLSNKTLVTPALGTPASGSLVNCVDVQYTGFKNRIINGAMVIDQRNAGAAITGTTSLLYSIDRFNTLVVTDGVMTFQQVADAPTGFTYSLRATATTADASLTATQRAILFQRIEGYNVADFMLGSANAVQFTASFWVKSSLTGTFGGSFQNVNSDRAYPFTYTISSASTWEKKTVTITGDTTGTWNTTNGSGLQIVWGLGVGSTFSGTAGAWAAGDFNSATGATSVIGTLNATWQVTGVQLEKGSTATSFDYRDYGRELMMCQRYYYRTPAQGDNAQHYNIVGRITGLNQSVFTSNLPVSMRAYPAISLTPAYNTGSGWQTNLAGVANAAWTSVPTQLSPELNKFCFYVSTATWSGTYVGTSVQPYTPTGAAANYIELNAEL
jgi:hypothetical protein